MDKRERKDELYELLLKDGHLTVSQLAARLYTSESSVRRDLAELSELGLIKRTHGGARAIASASTVIPFSKRSFSATVEKRKIAAKAATLIKDGATVFLDQSSTSYFLALELLHRTGLTVVTNNLEILSLLGASDNTLISTGGTVSKHNTNCLIGREAARGFENIFADLAFFSCKAIDKDGVISDCEAEEIAVREAMLKNAKTRVLLIDSTKLGTRSVFKQCTLGEVEVAVCDAPLDLYKRNFGELVTL